jgi:hypothetical protein
MNTQELPKPRRDSRLKTLPEERQDEIAEYALKHSLRQTAHWLCESGVPTSFPAVSRFLDWYKTKQTLQRLETVSDTLVSELAKEKPELPPERLHQIGNHFFTSLALAEQDHKAWYMSEQIALRNARLKLETRKFEHEIQVRHETITGAGQIDQSQAGLTPETRQEIETKNNLL